MNAQHNQNKEGGGSPSQRSGGLSWSQPANNSAGEGGFKPITAPKLAVESLQKKAPLASVSSGTMSAGWLGASNKRTVGMLFAGGAVLGLVLGWMVFGGGKDDSPLATGAATTTEIGTASAGDQNSAQVNASGGTVATGADSFVVPPVQPAGLSVLVTQAFVSGSTWIVVYESRNGERGNALGAALFNAERTSGTIRLLRGTLAGETYFVGAHRDNGDRIFSLEKDLPIVGANNEPVYVEFRAE